MAQGAAYYGVVRRGGGIRIGGGTARSFYVGIETQNVATPWMCVVPRDAQEGDEITIDRPRLRPADGSARGLPAGQQLGPARRLARAGSSPPIPTRFASCLRSRA